MSEYRRNKHVELGGGHGLTIGKQFMDRMEEYMELQDTPDFDVQQHLMELYEDLSNLYNDYNNE